MIFPRFGILYEEESGNPAVKGASAWHGNMPVNAAGWPDEFWEEKKSHKI
jgi:hypothetical protein